MESYSIIAFLLRSVYYHIIAQCGLVARLHCILCINRINLCDLQEQIVLDIQCRARHAS